MGERGLAHTGRYHPLDLRVIIDGTFMFLSGSRGMQRIQRSRFGRDAARSFSSRWQFSSQCHRRRLCRNKEWRTLCSDKVNLHALAPGARLKHTAAPRLSSMRRCCFLIHSHSSCLRIAALFALPSINGSTSAGGLAAATPPRRFQCCAWYHHQMRYSDETCDACQSPIAEHLCPFSPGREMDGLSIDGSSRAPVA